MFSFIALALIVSSVSCLVVHRAPSASNWSNFLEDYDIYHSRYLTNGCHNKHSTRFFDQCCHPLLKGLQPDPSCGLSSATPDSDSDEDHDCAETDVSVSERADNYSDYDTPPDNTPSPEAKIANVDLANTSGWVQGGYATFYYQHGNAGACGQYHGDYDMIAAMDSRRYGNTSKRSWMCGKRVKIINTQNGKSVTVTIADACPTCDNSNSIDLSVGAFKAIASLSTGQVSIKWQLLD